MAVAGKRKRTRVTRKDIDLARQTLPVQPRSAKAKPEREEPIYKKDFWYGLVYCDSDGYASIVGRDLQGKWLGRTDEFIPYLKSKGIDGENVDRVLQASHEFRSEKKSHSCHLATETSGRPMASGGQKTIVATLKKDPHFLASLDALISQGKGIRVIHSELRSKGYEVPKRTLGRWINKRQDTT